MSHAWKKWLWWIGAPISASLVSVLPYWGWNIFGGVPSWWRVPAVTPGLFDTYVYFNWMAAAAEGLAYGGHLKWLGNILEMVWPLFKGRISVPELWILSRCVTFTLTLWITAWAFEIWSGLTRTHGRILSVAFFSAVVLTLGMRPGVYAWYLPFCIAGLTCALFAQRALARDAWVHALVLSVVALALAWLYPWFFMLVGTWLAVLWCIRIARFRSWAFPVLAAMSAFFAFVAAVPIARWFLDPAQAGLIGMYERNGTVFARVPLFANTLLAIGAWLVFLLVLARRAADPDARKRITRLGGIWVVILLLWFHTPITGLHLYSDHFIGPVTVLAWISLAVVWAWSQGTEERPETVRLFRWVPVLVACGATLFFLYVLQQPLRANIWRFDSYVIHLAHWFALAVAAWIATGRLHRPAAVLSNRVIGRLIVISAVLMGLGGIIPVFIRDLPIVQTLEGRIPVIAWIRSETSADARMCADPETASFYAAHTGRHVFPAEATLSWPDSSEQIIRHLETLVRSYDVRGAGAEGTFRFFTDHYRTVSCAGEGEYSRSTPSAHLLSRLGFSPDRVNELIGCDKRTLETNRQRMDAAMDLHTTDLVAFPALCSYVIMPLGQKPYWHLPPGYTERRITPEVSVWQKP